MRRLLPVAHVSLVGAAVCVLALPSARAELPLRDPAGRRLVPAYDPALDAKPPMMKAIDGSSRQLLLPEGFAERAAAFRRRNPGFFPAQAGMGQVGEVVIVEGSDEVLTTDGGALQVRMAGVSRKVIERYGDNFQAMTLWLTFDESASSSAGAYERTVKADVRGLGMTPGDNTQMYGSAGTLRSMLNMKRVWQGVREDTLEAWRPQLEVWGQESGHRWMMFMGVRDPRDGTITDALLGRDCTHYSRFVDTQGSVHDGLSWVDNRDGTFSIGSDRTFRFGNLDLYGMGLLPADEMPPFFFIDNIPGYRRPSCRQYSDTPKPLQNQISGTRVDVTIDDIVAANGSRIPSSDELLAGARQDYFREVQVVVTRAGERADSPLPTQVAQRIDRARLLWEQWMREATGNRMVVCTQVSRDCGDPRSDVVELAVNSTLRSPTWGPIPVQVKVANRGQRESNSIQLDLVATFEDRTWKQSRSVGSLAAGAERTLAFDLDLPGVPCGSEVVVKASTQSDAHYHRLRYPWVAGADTPFFDAFEIDSGWVVNPDGDDTSAGAVWERGTPERTEITAGRAVQIEGAHTGKGAWVTGAAASSGTRDPFVRAGRSTLESGELDASAWREPRVRYWVSFAGMKAGPSGLAVVASSDARLLVLARAQPDAGGPNARPWVEIDRLENQINVAWALRSVRLPAELTGSRIKLRFVAEDANPQTGGVEAAIDDVQITSNVAECYQPPPAPPKSGGCSLTPTPAGHTGAGLWLLALCLLAFRIIASSRAAKTTVQRLKRQGRQERQGLKF